MVNLYFRPLKLLDCHSQHMVTQVDSFGMKSCAEALDELAVLSTPFCWRVRHLLGGCQMGVYKDRFHFDCLSCRTLVGISETRIVTMLLYTS